MTQHTIWIEQCEAAKGIEAEFGTDKARAYLIGEKFINFLEAAEDNAAFAKKFQYPFSLLRDVNRENGLAYGAADDPKAEYARRTHADDMTRRPLTGAAFFCH